MVVAAMLLGVVVSHVSGQVIEVFLLAGQSNADGSNSYYYGGQEGKGPGLSPVNSFYADNETDVQYAYAHANPFSGTVDRYLTGGLGALRPAAWGMMGPELSLGRALADGIANDVAFLKYTSPGTSLNTQWGPDDALLYPDMVDFFNDQLALLAGSYTTVHLNTLFWHQGESDSGVTYAADFTAMFDTLRTDLGAPDLHAVMGRISENFDPGNTGVIPRSNVVAVNDAIVTLAAGSGLIAETGSLTDIALHDYIHFPADGQVVHGERMAASYFANPNLYQEPVPEPGAAILLVLAGLSGLARRGRPMPSASL